MRALQSTGSSDPDVLYARKEELLAPARKIRQTAKTRIIVGSIATLTGIGAIAGIPLILRGLRKIRETEASITAIEAAFEAYMSSAVKTKTKPSFDEIELGAN